MRAARAASDRDRPGAKRRVCQPAVPGRVASQTRPECRASRSRRRGERRWEKSGLPGRADGTGMASRSWRRGERRWKKSGLPGRADGTGMASRSRGGARRCRRQAERSDSRKRDARRGERRRQTSGLPRSGGEAGKAGRRRTCLDVVGVRAAGEPSDPIRESAKRAEASGSCIRRRPRTRLGEPQPWQGEAQPKASRAIRSEKARSAPRRADPVEGELAWPRSRYSHGGPSGAAASRVNLEYGGVIEPGTVTRSWRGGYRAGGSRPPAAPPRR